MNGNPFDASETCDEIEVILDGLPVELPSEYQSLCAIRCQLEALALERQLACGMTAKELATIRRWLAKIAADLQAT